jgi:type I restriction enzyme S subunit
MGRINVRGEHGQLPRIRTEEVATVEIDIPSIEEQQRITAAIAKRIETTEQTITAIEAQLDPINALPAALLRRAFAGEV